MSDSPIRARLGGAPGSRISSSSSARVLQAHFALCVLELLGHARPQSHAQGINHLGAVIYDEGMATENGSTTEDEVLEALEEVIDPELGLDFVSLGLVYDVEVEGPEVYVTFTLTTPACPIGPQVSEQMKEFVGELPGVEKVHPKMIFDPPWSPEMMSEDAKFALGY
jgi:metal-sulfur cluster biosynthetic enzyme